MVYSDVIKAKNGDDVPLFSDGKPVHSRYNPRGEKICIQDDFEGCAVVVGIGAGYHLESLLSDSRISLLICVERDEESLEFCKKIGFVNHLAENDKIRLCTFDSFKSVFMESYMPVLHRNLTVAYLNSWRLHNEDASVMFSEIFRESVSLVSSDFSVQSHFGRLWHRNIFMNLKKNVKIDFHADASLCAAVVAAGPTLDSSVQKIKSRRNHYFVISTDTSYGTLILNGILPDVVVSIDAQHVSCEHFLSVENRKDGENTLFVFDVASSPEAVDHVMEKGWDVFFVRSNHPLSAILSEYAEIPLVESGSGTVTIAACDFARLAGFREIELFGADFSYSGGKPYAKGNYLEKKFNSVSGRMQNGETLFASLMYRTELFKNDKMVFSDFNGCSYASRVLKSYERTMLEWAEKHSFSLKKNNLCNACNRKSLLSENLDSCARERFVADYVSELGKLVDVMKSGKIPFGNSFFFSVLPYISARKNCSFFDALKLAYNDTLRYNGIL